MRPWRLGWSAGGREAAREVATADVTEPMLTRTVLPHVQSPEPSNRSGRETLARWPSHVRSSYCSGLSFWLEQARMITVGAFEAKTRLSALLEQVAAGEDVLITKHGKAIARLVKAEDAARGDVDAAIARLKALRAGSSLGADWKRLRDEGRR